MSIPKRKGINIITKTKQNNLGKLLRLSIPLILAGIYLLIFVAVFCVNFYWMHTRKSKIQAALTNSLTMKGTIVEIGTGRRDHHATFIFNADGKIYKGQTFQDYQGNLGDSICITYNTLQPAKNIYCTDATIETFKKDVLQKSAIDSLLFTALLVFIFSLTMLRQKLNAKKKTNMLP